MTTTNHHANPFGSAVRWSAAGLFAGMAVTVWSPRSVPYVTAGLVVLTAAHAIAERVVPAEGAS